MTEVDFGGADLETPAQGRHLRKQLVKKRFGEIPSLFPAMKLCFFTIFMTGIWLGVLPRPRVCGPLLQITPLSRGFQVGAFKIHLGDLGPGTSQSDHFHYT